MEMGRIDTSRWGEFMVGDMFDIHPTKAYKLTNAELLDGGDSLVVVNSAYNNGIGGMSSKATTEKGNMITFSDTVDANTIYYQEKEFVGYPHVQGLYPIGKYADCWKRESLLFFVSSFRKTALTKGFDYGNKFRRDVAIKLKVRLPIDSSGNPDWLYMEDYMRKIEITVRDTLTKLQSAKNLHTKEIDVSRYKRFHLYDDDLFTIDSGTKLDKIKMSNESPSINFVGRANANNGVTDYIDEIEGLKPYEAGLLTISLGGEYLGSCFVQDKPFYTSQNVNVLIPKHEMSYYCKKYIATMVFKEGRLHYKAFIDELNRHMKTDFTIPLPVDENGNIDWSYMEQYMKDVEQRAIQTIDCLIV